MNDLRFSTTPYKGHEKDVLLVLNRNRPEPKEQRYLDWRYTSQNGPVDPVVFWVCHGNKRVGMAGIVFRPYLIDGRQEFVAVLGDIALDEAYRGSGIAQRFFRFINEYLGEHGHPLALVLPNTAAEKAISRCGWHTVDDIVSFVFLLNPSDKIVARLRVKRLADAFGQGYRLLNSIWLRIWRKKGFAVDFPADFDDPVSELWRDMSKEGIIIRERSPKALHARYRLHPDSSGFLICRVTSNSRPVGIIVYSMSEDRRHCFLYELLVGNINVIRPVMAVFIDRILNEYPVTSLRINLNTRHPYTLTLRKMGFIKREKIQALQVRDDGSPRLTEKRLWIITAGDKDV